LALRESLRGFPEIRRRDRARYFLKSFVRHHLLDWRKRWYLDRALRAQGLSLKIDESRFLAGDARSAAFSEVIPDASVDLIYCLDVFEHLSSRALVENVPRMHKWLKPSGLALIRLRLYTGTTGGHLAECRPHPAGELSYRKTEPWKHLREGHAHANAVVNRLRERDYVRLLQPWFEILECVRPDLGLGAEYLSPEIERELGDYARDELLTNEAFLVLKPANVRVRHRGN
jgi:hypothetical protein